MTYKRDFIIEAIDSKPASREKLLLLLRKHVKSANESLPKFSALLRTYRELLQAGEIDNQPWLEQLLTKRTIRTLSGVAPVHVMTAPLGCPANCLYCPREPGMPKSYLSNQPGAMRAILNDFDPYKQVSMRLRALYQNGHHPEKIELIENGGTWSALPKRYRIWFMTHCYQAANDFDSNDYQETTDFISSNNSHLTILNRLKNQPDHLLKKTLRLHDDDDDDLLLALFEAQKINETSKFRIIGVTIETRPDWLTNEEIIHLRQIGCTKIELGVQNTADQILSANNRGHGSDAVKQATQKLRDAGFKVAYHIMPGMYQANEASDLQMFTDLFSDPAYKPDFLKIYPCVVVKEAKLYDLWKNGRYKPYNAQTLLKILVKIKKNIPRYCRIARLVRDIPTDCIADGNKISNLRELVKKESKKQGIKCQCIRCREVMRDVHDENLILNHFAYETINGTECFLSFDGKTDDRLYAFLRLRLPQQETTIITELKNCALVRELHTYGQLARLSNGVSTKSDETEFVSLEKAQHKGLGKQLMFEAEKIALQAGFKKIAVIAGIGTREYYKKLGYELDGTYMVKQLIK